MSTMAFALERAAGNAQSSSHFTKVASARTWVRVITVILPSVFLAAVLMQPWVEAKWMFLDPLTAAQLSGDCCHTYYGFVSQAGVMLWSATAAVCLFAAAVFAIHRRSRELILFAASAGILTGWLALDDTFLVHEVVLPSFGIPQNAVLAAIAAMGIAYALLSWRMIFKSDFWMLGLAGGALALSMVVDTVFHSLVPQLVYLEDSAKFFGIFCWASFHIVAMAENLSPAARRA